MLTPKQPERRQVLRDEYVHRCQDPKCPKTVPTTLAEMAGWISIEGMAYTEGAPQRFNALWFCSWSHLAGWSDENAIKQVTQP